MHTNIPVFMLLENAALATRYDVHQACVKLTEGIILNTCVQITLHE